MKIGFATCVQLGFSCIKEIYKLGGKLDLLITLNDYQALNKSGRIYLDDFAKENGILIVKSKNINDEIIIDTIIKEGLDWLFIIGWSQIAKKELLNTPTMGCIGMHPTLLPKGRGRAAIPWAIIKGLNKTGVTMFKLDEGIDTGDIIGQESIDLVPDITATMLYQKVNDAHISLIDRFWNDIVANRLQLKKQDNMEATIWPERKPKDGEIYQEMSIAEADRLVRAVTHPYPGAFYKMDDKIYRIWTAEFSRDEGMLKLKDGYLTPLNYEIEDD